MARGNTLRDVLPPLDPVKPLDRLLLRLERSGLLEDINRICAEGGILIEEVFGGSQRLHITRVRHFIWWWLHDEKRWGYRAIAELCGVQPSGVKHGLEVARRELGLVPGVRRGPRRAA